MTIQEHKESIRVMMTELSATRHKYDELNSLIKQKQSKLRKMVQQTEKENSIVYRDIEICRKYIEKNPGCPSKNIVAHLNVTMATTQYKRWTWLDSNTFMGIMGVYLENSGLFTNEKTVVDGNYTNIWKLK